MSPALPTPDISNLAACTEDARLAALVTDTGPAEPTNYDQLLVRLDAARPKMPPMYRQIALDPFKAKLVSIGQNGFHQILLSDPQREGAAGLMLDIAQTFLQNGEGFENRATDAFEEVVSDLYAGFLSAEDRRGVNPPDLGVVPPLVKWGNPDFGPYTWPGDATENFDVKCAVVNLPPANARGGVLAWSALGHETGGHDIIHADNGLESQLATAVGDALDAAGFNQISEYWANRIDETASDVLGILNMGPAAGIGLIGYFRGLDKAFGGPGKLRSNGPSNDPHPADIVRGYLAAATVRLLLFSNASAWAKLIDAETDKDAGNISLAGVSISVQQAKASAAVVAKAIAKGKMAALEHVALATIQNWRNSDERVTARLRQAMSAAVPVSSSILQGAFAAHAVAAAVTAALAGEAPVPVIFDRMQGMLKQMHDQNPAWGPLFVRHPGSIFKHRLRMDVDDADFEPLQAPKVRAAGAGRK
ncbi:MAG: hypothetical protein U0Q16_31040 [Bryobacteraceae bacterium]